MFLLRVCLGHWVWHTIVALLFWSVCLSARSQVWRIRGLERKGCKLWYPDTLLSNRCSTRYVSDTAICLNTLSPSICEIQVLIKIKIIPIRLQYFVIRFRYARPNTTPFEAQQKPPLPGSTANTILLLNTNPSTSSTCHQGTKPPLLCLADAAVMEVMPPPPGGHLAAATAVAAEDLPVHCSLPPRLHYGRVLCCVFFSSNIWDCGLIWGSMLL